MPIYQRLQCVVPLALGFALVVAGGYAAFYIAPVFQELPFRALVSLMSVAVVAAGVLVIARSFRQVEALSEAAEEPHIPGLDVEVPGARRPMK